MTTVVVRPGVDFDPEAHRYTLSETGEVLVGVSSVAKIGGADDAFSIASAWGFRVGYEGAFEVMSPLTDGCAVEACGGPTSKDALREVLKQRGLTPWASRDKAGVRGTFVHDTLEALAQDGEVPTLDEIEDDEQRGHVESILKWYAHFRPEIVAQEVQVASVIHRFAGRFDMRAKIQAHRLLPLLDPLRDDPQAERIRELACRGEWALGLLDLKTSKRIYPTTHFPQLEGYEGASVEMGYPATDFRAVINTNPDGSFEPTAGMAISWSTYEDFTAFAEALRAIKRIKAADPEAKREALLFEALLDALPTRSNALVGTAPVFAGMDSRAIGAKYGMLKKRGLVTQEKGVWSRA